MCSDGEEMRIHVVPTVDSMPDLKGKKRKNEQTPNRPSNHRATGPSLAHKSDFGAKILTQSSQKCVIENQKLWSPA